MWSKIKKLREFIKLSKNFKKRTCWQCGKDLNIYDFLSDNLEYTADEIFILWQTPLLEFHCCECFKNLKIHELEQIERELKNRYCSYCNNVIDLYNYSKKNNYLKIHELKSLWLNKKNNLFCNPICRRKYNNELKESFIFLDK